MAITNVTHSVNLSGSVNVYLNHPANVGMSAGYWYYYSSSVANNTLLAKIKPYRWGSALATNETGNVLTIDGTIVLVTESLVRRRIFHGGGIVRAEAGTNIQTGQVVDDQFYFYHLGDLNASDNVGYWDLAYLPQGGSQWDYFQYHQHLPNVYEDFNNGRQIQNSGYFINDSDKRFAHVQPTAISNMGTGYTNVLLRVHQPSQGGAHNSHTDVELATGNTAKDYVIAGVVQGTSNRFHAFYLSSGTGTKTNVFGRTFVLSSNTVTAEVNYGEFDLAPFSASTTIGTGLMEQFPLRASTGILYGTKCYVPIIYSGSTGFDLKVWEFESTDTVLGSSITTSSIATSLTRRPDCHLGKTSNRLFAIVSDVANGGADFYINNGTSTWVNSGSIVTNGTQDVIRVHGTGYNSVDGRYYTLLSGDITGSGNYSGSGIYSFTDDQPFSGYKHISYLTASYGFQTKNALEVGYVNFSDGAFIFSGSVEPSTFAENDRILTYDYASPQFYAKTDTKVGGSEYYYHGIRLSDGRLVGVGNIEGNIENRGGGGEGNRDLLIAIYSDTGTDSEFIGTGGTGDDFFTAVIEDTGSQCLWLTGYTKSELVDKKDLKIHAYGRTLNDGGNKLEWKDLAIDAAGNQYYAGFASSSLHTIAAMYDPNMNLVWSVELTSSSDPTKTDEAYGITLDNSNNVYICGGTDGGGAGQKDAFIVKLNPSGALQWSKFYGTTKDEYASSIISVTKSSTNYLVSTIVSASSTIINVIDTSGTIVEQNRVDNFIANRVRKSDSETDGYFLLAGTDNASPTKAVFAKGQVLATGTMLKWIRSYSAATSASAGYDIRNTEQASGAGGLGSETGPVYHIVGQNQKNGFISKFVMDEAGGNFQSTQKWATRLSGSVFTALTNTPYTDTITAEDEEEGVGRRTYVVGYTSASLEGEGGLEGLVVGFSGSGKLLWANTLGHTDDEILNGIERDVTGNNIFSAGWSESHTEGRRTMGWRSSIGGLGTGNYHEKDSTGMQMWYQSSSLSSSADNGTLATVTVAANIAGGLTTTNGTFASQDRLGQFSEEFYDGGNVYDMFIAKFDLNAWSAYRNTEAHKTHDELRRGQVEYVDSVFTFYQWGTAGDGTADDGNFFGYDIIKMSGSNELLVAGQTSGNVGKTNIGQSGVYDYILTVFNPDTEEWEFYQNGTELDEEIYAAEVLNDGSGSVAFVGRTAGTLGGPIIGNYDIFLGIYNPISDVITYFNTGSGQNDRAVNVHDLGNNELAVVFEAAANVGDRAIAGGGGGFDLGVIKFNYSSSKWSGSAYMVGTQEDEILSQDGKPSVYLPETNRIGIVGKSIGTFADDGNSYGNNDMVLGILNLNDGTWNKYQIGTPANETGTTIFRLLGDRIIIGGYSDASFQEPNNGVFCVFDATIGIKGKSS